MFKIKYRYYAYCDYTIYNNTICNYYIEINNINKFIKNIGSLKFSNISTRYIICG